MGVSVNCELLTIHEHLYDCLTFRSTPQPRGNTWCQNVVYNLYILVVK